MKKNLVITREQFQRLEEVTLGRTGSGALSSSEVNDTINNNTELINQATQQYDSVTIPGEGSMEGASINIPVKRGTNVNSSIVNQALADNTKELTNGASVTLVPSTNGTTNTTFESRRFTKKQLEEARIANMKKNGRTCTKKTLFEEVGDDEINIDELADFCKNEDFYIYINVPFKGGWEAHAVNTNREVRDEVIADIYYTKPQHFSNEMKPEMERILAGKVDNIRGVVKLIGTRPKDNSHYTYFVVWDN